MLLLRQERAQHRHERILEAALQVFSRRGYRDASIDDIADAAKTSKGGVYFHFPNKETIFLHLLDRTATRLLDKIETAILDHNDPIAKADAALGTVFHTFASHRALARLFIVEALGAGREFHRRMAEIREQFAAVLKRHLDEAVITGVIVPLDTDIAGRAWFGALNEVLTHWVLTGQPKRLEDAYAALRPLLLRSVGITAAALPSGRKR